MWGKESRFWLLHCAHGHWSANQLLVMGQILWSQTNGEGKLTARGKAEELVNIRLFDKVRRSSTFGSLSL
jgi:hypothetical protein